MAATPPEPDAGGSYVSDVLDALAPMGGYTLDAPDGGEVHVCGELNAPPSVVRIRTALRAAGAAGFDAEAIYRRAVVMYRTLNERRREAHPRWDWPAPPYDDVRPGGRPSPPGAQRSP